MRVRRNLRLKENDRIAPAGLSKIVKRKTRTLTGVHGSRPLQVGEREIRLAIAAISCAEQREESGVLRERQELTVAPCPALGCEIERKDTNFRYEWISHWINFRR